MKRLISIFLAVILTFAFMAAMSACSSEGNTSGDTPDIQSDDAAETTVSEENAVFVDDDLPADLKFNGETVNILIGDYASAFAYEMYVEEETGNRYDDTVYRAVVSVEERLAADLNYTIKPYVWGGRDAHLAGVTGTLLAGDNTFDILFDEDNFAVQMLDNQYFANLAETEYINLDKPWYNKSFINDLANDYVHFLVGDYSIANVKHAFLIFANTDLLESLGRTENLYEAVYSGGWTLAKMKELIKDSYSDLNGNGERDAADRYGLSFGDANKYIGFSKAFDVIVFEKSGDDYEFRWDSERAVSAVEDFVNFVNGDNNVLPAGKGKDDTELCIASNGGNFINKQFVSGQALLTASLISDAIAIIPEVDFNYGVLPYPKYSESDEYQSALQRTCKAMISSLADTRKSSAVLEALSSCFYRVVMPEYCEVTLNTRYSPNDDVSRIYDLIRGSVIYETADIYEYILDSPQVIFVSAVSNNNPNWASTAASHKDRLIASMNTVFG